MGVMAAALAAYATWNLAAGSGAGALAPVVHGTALAVVAALAFLVLRRRPATNVTRVEIPPDYLPTIRRLVSSIDATDPFTRGRSYRIARFCVRIGEKLGLSGHDLQDLECAALLHDIGRTEVQTDLLRKTGRLSAGERAVLSDIPRRGCDMLRDIPYLAGAAEIVHAQQEQPDGKGYPQGLAAKDIPPGSRILKVVKAFDAMTSDRPYRRGLSPVAVYDELREHAGTMFFSEVVDALIELHESGEIFAGFDRDELALYASGTLSSRALETYLEERPGLAAAAVEVDPHRRVAGARPDEDEIAISIPGDVDPLAREAAKRHDRRSAA